MSATEPTSPLRLLEHSCRGGLETGGLGVVMARHGLGKTTLVVGLGLETALLDQCVLHIALNQTLEHCISVYETLFEDLVHRTDVGDPYEARVKLGRRRVIQALPGRHLTNARLRQVIDLYAGSLDLTPALILIDGYDWERQEDHAASLRGFKEVAAELGAAVWMTATTHREETPAQPTATPPPCDRFVELIDLALYVEPSEQNVQLRFLKDHDATTPPSAKLELDPDTMRALPSGPGESWLPRAYTLLSGGHAGAECAFGEEAEKWGVRERNFSFAGREPSRRVAVVELGQDALHEGEVSTKFVEARLHRSFPDTETWRYLIDTIWHQVATAGQVFVIGSIREDSTVRGGTGWAAELAKHFRKPLFVFDQEGEAWHTWVDGHWEKSAPPRIWNRRFCGTGTRSLSPAGRAAIADLFYRSFSGG